MKVIGTAGEHKFIVEMEAHELRTIGMYNHFIGNSHVITPQLTRDELEKFEASFDKIEAMAQRWKYRFRELRRAVEQKIESLNTFGGDLVESERPKTSTEEPDDDDDDDDSDF